jgi:hypothetical protein
LISIDPNGSSETDFIRQNTVKTTMKTTHTRSRVQYVSILALGLFAASSAHAAVMVSNLGSGVNTQYGSNGGGFVSARFTVGTSDVMLDSVTLRLAGGFQGDGEDGDIDDGNITYNAFLYSDGSGRPGSQLASLGSWSRTDVGGPFLSHDFTDASNTLLTSGTSYWVSVNSGLDSGGWQASASPTVTGQPGWGITNGGYIANISLFANASPLFAVNATAVPEPTSALMSALGASMLLRRRRRQVA